MQCHRFLLYKNVCNYAIFNGARLKVIMIKYSERSVCLWNLMRISEERVRVNHTV